MIKVAICDDDSYFRKTLQGYLSKYLSENGFVFQIDLYSSGEEFITLGLDMFSYTIVFLDINMNEIDGITTAKKIREISKDVFIVFVTAYVNYTLEGYKVDAIRYLLKDLKKEENFRNSINECMDAIIEKMNYVVVKKQFHFQEGTKQISLDRILYIESRLHKLEFHIMENDMKVYTIYDTLNHLEQELAENDFVRVHQSYLVNLKYIKGVVRYKAVLINGMELTIPKARYMDVRNRFIAYQGEI